MRYAAVCLCVLALSGCKAKTDKAANRVPPVPDAADAIAGLDGVKLKKDKNGNVVEADFRGLPVSAKLFGHLVGLPKLRSLVLGGTETTDATLEPIGKLKTVTNLDLRGCPVSNDGLQHLAEMSQLKGLKLSGESNRTTVNDDGLAYLANLANLKAVALDYLWVSEEGIAHIPKENLEELYLKKTLIGDEALALLKECPRLKKLRVSFCQQVSDAGLEHLSAVHTLEDVDFSETSLLTDSGMAHIGRMKKLKKLNLWRVVITDEGVAHLAGLTNMESLNLDNTQLGDAGLAHLQKMPKLNYLHVGSTQITDEGLPQLAVLKNLADLKLTRTSVTEQGVEKLAELLPKTSIQLKYTGNE